MFKKLIYLASFVLVLALAGSATANKVWTGDGGDNLWSNPANWADDGESGENYYVDINGVTVLIDSGDQTAGDGARIGYDSNNVTLNITGGSLTGGKSQLAYKPGASCTINVSGDGAFISTGYIRMAYDVNTAGTINLSDNATLESASYLRMYGPGVTAVNITDNATMHIGGYLRSAYKGGCTTHVTVNGNGTLIVDDIYRVANNEGDGYLTIQDNGMVKVKYELLVPASDTASGTVNLEGGTLEVGFLTMSEGTGLLDIGAGLLVIDGNAVPMVTALVDGGKIAAYGARAGDEGFGTTKGIDVTFDPNANTTTVTAYQPPGPFTVTETFDTDLGNFDLEFGNVEGDNNFGFSDTNNAGGDPGELGGTVARSDVLRFVADVTIGTLTTNDELKMSGQFMLNNINFDGEFHFGYFNTESGSDLGFRFHEPGSGSGDSFRLQIDGGGDQTGKSDPPHAPTNQVVNFNLTFAPSGNGDGSGTLSGQIGGEDVTLDVGANEDVYNAFGLQVGFVNSSRADKADVYFDNLEYTIAELAPESSP